MCRQTLIQYVSLGMFVVVVACSNKKESHVDQSHEHEETSEGWKEMDAFHMVMAQAFHPFKDSANLQPAKENAPALVTTAEDWANSPLPKKFEEDDEIKFKITQLKKDAATFADVVENGNDKAIGESLIKLHNLFHAIQEAWYGEEEH